MRFPPQHVVRGAAALLALASQAHAGRLAGTVHVRSGAVAAFSGKGDGEQVRRSPRSLRVDLGERIRTSPQVEAVFIGHDETQTPLEAGSRYQVERDGLWRVEGELRVRVLEFLRAPGASARAGDPAPDASLANVRGVGTPRVRGARDFEAHNMGEDEALGANSTLITGYQGEVLLALVGGGRAVAHEETRLHLQRRALVLRQGRLHARAGGPTQLVLTPRLAVAAEPGALVEVEVDAAGAVRARCFGGRVVLGPPPRGKGARRPLEAGWEAELGVDGALRVRPVLHGAAVAAARDGLAAALEDADPRGVARRSREASQVTLPPTPVMASSPEPAPPLQVGRAPEAPPRVAPETVDEAALAVARSLTPGGVSNFGSSWEPRDRRDPRRRPAPASLPPGLSGTSQLDLASPGNQLWSSAHAVRTY